MKIQKALFGIVAAAIFFCMIAIPQTALSEEEKFEPLPGEGKKCPLGEGYFQYSFDKKPQLGMIILKIEVFGKDGKKDTSFKITGDSGMPSMRGHHDTGMVEFKLNKNGDYLLPVNVVMPGDWDLRLIFTKAGKPVYKGSFNFNV
jgi:hypothetical protein